MNPDFHNYVDTSKFQNIETILNYIDSNIKSIQGKVSTDLNERLASISAKVKGIRENIKQFGFSNDQMVQGELKQIGAVFKEIHKVKDLKTDSTIRPKLDIVSQQTRRIANKLFIEVPHNLSEENKKSYVKQFESLFGKFAHVTRDPVLVGHFRKELVALLKSYYTQFDVGVAQALFESIKAYETLFKDAQEISSQKPEFNDYMNSKILELGTPGVDVHQIYKSLSELKNFVMFQKENPNFVQLDTKKLAEELTKRKIDPKNLNALLEKAMDIKRALGDKSKSFEQALVKQTTVKDFENVLKIHENILKGERNQRQRAASPQPQRPEKETHYQDMPPQEALPTTAAEREKMRRRPMESFMAPPAPAQAKPTDKKGEYGPMPDIEQKKENPYGKIPIEKELKAPKSPYVDLHGQKVAPPPPPQSTKPPKPKDKGQRDVRDKET